jgi:tetratricopeptide (TPR) repeat protein
MVRRLATPRVLGGVIVALVLGALGFLNDLFAGPGYEVALAAGLLCPSVAAIVTALELSKRARAPLDMLGRGIENGALFAFVAYVVAFLHGARAGFCDLASGTTLFALGPGVGSLLGGAWGAIASEPALHAKRRRLVGVLVALSGTIGSALLQVAIFYATPMVFAFDPFVGYFSGALYDTVLASDELVGYRVASAATLFASYVAVQHLERSDGKLRRRAVERPGLLALGVIAAVGSLASVIEGNELGHWQTKATIAHHLGGHIEVGHCSVIYDIDLEPVHVQRFAHDCDAQATDIAAWLEIEVSAPVTAYLFQDRGQKRYYMGAGRVSVAKPWRREIYLHDQDYPHRVVRHELVHALAADIGSGPFRVAGGLLPNPGLVEGLAEAAAPRDDNLDGHDWAAAMRAIKVLPRTHQLFGLAFFGRASSAGYTAAGSFLSHIRDTFGVDAIKRWYGGEAITDITSKSWQDLEQGWWQRLDAIELTNAARITAELRFDRPSVFDRRCPHEVDALLDRGLGRIGGDNAGALTTLAEVLELDPSNVRALMGIAQCHDSKGDSEAAHSAYDVVTSHEAASRSTRLTAQERQADLLLRAGDTAAARALYQPLLESLTEEGRRRTLELKIHYADHDLGRAALVALLIGTDHRGSDNIEALDHIGAWRAAAPEDGTPQYLLGRQHFNRQRYALAVERFDQALAAGMPVRRAQSETLRLKLIAACALGDVDQAKEALAAYRAHELVPPPKQRIAAALVARCATTR